MLRFYTNLLLCYKFPMWLRSIFIALALCLARGGVVTSELLHSREVIHQANARIADEWARQPEDRRAWPPAIRRWSFSAKSVPRQICSVLICDMEFSIFINCL